MLCRCVQKPRVTSAKNSRTFKPQQFALAELVADVRDDLLPSGESDFELTNDVAVDLVIDADRDQFYRVIGNIARNAAEDRCLEFACQRAKEW